MISEGYVTLKIEECNTLYFNYMH